MTMNNTSKKWNKSQYFSGSQSIFGEVSSSRFRESRFPAPAHELPPSNTFEPYLWQVQSHIYSSSKHFPP